MSTQRHDEHVETVFSFELLVECVRLEEEESDASDELALGVRLLDFPTLLIEQPRRGGGGDSRRARRGKCRRGEHVFNRGKSCFFRTSMSSLRARLSSSPLYAMVLDVREEIPKLVGTSLISLAGVMERIGRDATDRGAATPSSHAERGVISVSDLRGEKIGSISLSYKLLSLGANASPHVADGKARGRVRERNVPTPPPSRPPGRGDVSSAARDNYTVAVCRNKASNEKWLIHEDEQDGDVRVATQTEHNKPRTQTPRAAEEDENDVEDLTILCPPPLFYTNSAEGKSDWKSPNRDCVAFRPTYEDTHSEEETSDVRIERVSSPAAGQGGRPSVKRNQQRNGVTPPDAFGEALQQFPLLNALLVELSRLSGQGPNRPLSVHPDLSRIYRPASPAPSVGHGNRTPEAPTNAPQKAGHVASPRSKHTRPNGNCSTTAAVRPASAKAKDERENASIRKRLTYGTTKSYRLRLRQLSSRGVRRHECVESTRGESAIGGKTRERDQSMKSGKRKSAVGQSAGVSEDVETTIQGIAEDAALHNTITLKRKNPNEEAHSRGGGYPPRVSDKSPPSGRDWEVVHSPGVDGNDRGAKDKDRNEPNGAESPPDRHGGKMESPGSSGRSSAKSSVSHSGGEGEENADYTDDFNSLEPSDGHSPEPASSPEASRSPAHPNSRNSDSGSDVVQRRASLPRPAQRGAHVLRTRTRASARSFSSSSSSSDDGGDGSASLQTAFSRKQTVGGRVERIPGARTLASPRGQSSERKTTGGPGQGFSEELVSSFEPQGTEEPEDELGSLDFRKEYQHISELVANKLPGYTM